ncbi:MAG TPA: VOC family protein [Rhodothermales bacterium]|nr:VOC family protein [Rhodothermales bacterium]
MSEPDAPQVECEQHHASLSVADVRAAVEFYTTRLGFWEAFTWGDPPTMAGVNIDHVQIFLGKGTPAPQGCSVYFVIGDADELHEFHRSNKVEIVEAPTDRPWGFRDYTVRDLDGYALTFGHRLHETEPPLEIDRVEVPVRLERRLAAVLSDLASRKRMSLSSCLEETLLHTFEPLGDGVASPHTRGDLRYIQELKRKHGLDYDCHASYRFVEREEMSSPQSASGNP